jgi:hypothetical protein
LAAGEHGAKPGGAWSYAIRRGTTCRDLADAGVAARGGFGVRGGGSRDDGRAGCVDGRIRSVGGGVGAGGAVRSGGAAVRIGSSLSDTAPDPYVAQCR